MSTSGKALPKIPSYSLLDAWRGLAAIWVVMVHSCLGYIVNHDPGARNNPLFSFSLLGQLGVVMFFVISGYCISGAAYSCISNRKSLNQYALDRIRRIYPPYLIACATSLAVSAVVSVLQYWHVIPSYSLPPKPLPLGDIHFWLTNLTLTQELTKTPALLFIAWSLCYEVAFYLIVGGFLLLSKMVGTSNPYRRNTALTCAHIVTTIA